jgi:hypothetical protein
VLKHSIFSNSYLNHRLQKNQEAHGEIHGSLAVSVKERPAGSLPICRMNGSTWWEAGWKLKK